jgi:protein-S-isoprenylcysteine O-methyltransferase Ste14
MSSRIVVTGLFAAFTAATASEGWHAGADAVSDPRLHAWLLVGYWLLKLGVAAAFTYFVLRREPSRRSSREPVAFAACTGAILSVVLLQPPAGDAAIALLIVGAALAVVGVGWLLASVLALGRCFGVLPEARGLVTRGPYRVVRHPVYLGELAACAGLVVMAPSAWNVACLVLSYAAQRVRMGLEERALEREFPEYAAYAAYTPRLLPWGASAPVIRRPAPLPEAGAS